MIKGKDLEELKVPKVAEIRAKLYEALGKSYAAGKKDSELKPLVGKLAVSANPTEVLEQVDIPEEVRENFKVAAEELEKSEVAESFTARGKKRHLGSCGAQKRSKPERLNRWMRLLVCRFPSEAL
ncbi:hypothetical protein [Parasutterella excrementihominis]|uniref:hypothetical protein n=1 Tax=Parasutterella excrementihominis TaxID=487175 RepID=UPI003AF1918C